jgi:hypothetical protein
MFSFDIKHRGGSRGGGGGGGGGGATGARPHKLEKIRFLGVKS